MKDIRRPIDPNSTRLMDRLKIHIRSNNLASTPAQCSAASRLLI